MTKVILISQTWGEGQTTPCKSETSPWVGKNATFPTRKPIPSSRACKAEQLWHGCRTRPLCCSPSTWMDAFARLAARTPACARHAGRSCQRGQEPAPLPQHPSPVLPKSSWAGGGKIHMPQCCRAGNLRHMAKSSPAVTGSMSIPPPLHWRFPTRWHWGI